MLHYFIPVSLFASDSLHPPTQHPHPPTTPGTQTASFENSSLLHFNRNYFVNLISNVKLSSFSSSFSHLIIQQIILISFQRQ